MTSQVALVVKDSPANAEGIRDVGLIPESGRSTGGGHGNPSSIPVLLPGKSHIRRSLVGCSPWGREESDTT